MTEISTQPPVPADFWAQINHQLSPITNAQASTFDEIRTVLLDPVYDEVTANVHRNFERKFDADSAFFAGSGGEATLAGALRAAGWKVTEDEASYYYAMVHVDTGEKLTYIEGDVVRGDQLSQTEPTVPVPGSSADPDTTWDVAWQIDADASSPAAAAAEVWKTNFNRGPHQPTPDDACVFDVSDGEKIVQIDLSDPVYAHLFDA